MALTETNLIEAIYMLYETDDTGWGATSAEYLTARGFLNAGLYDWKMRQDWRDLWSTLTAAADGTKTLTAGTYSYLTPTNFVRPNSWVRTTTGTTNTFWQVIPVDTIAKYSSDEGYYCYFTGSVSAGFYLNFNSRKTLTTGHTINYEYYKEPTPYTATTTKSEIPDPYYLVYYSLARLLKNDGEDFSYEETKSREIMDRMEVNNIQGYWDVNNPVSDSLSALEGFGV